MLTRNWPRHLLCLSLSLPLGSALACGPDFPMRLLDNRGQTLADLPEGNFNFELSRLGKAIAGDEDSYRYLAESIRMHPDQDTLKSMMDSAGFERTDYHNLTGGIVALHRGFKL